MSGPAPARPGADPGVEIAARPDLKPPPLYRVILHNDDYTTQEFVVFILRTVFRKAEPEAVAIMLSVHRGGQGLAGIYPRDTAETKVERVRTLAESEGYPLLCTMEADA